MKVAPNIWELPNLMDYVNKGQCQAGIEVAGGTIYVPARPLGFYSWGQRLRAAWMVYTGKADALLWPGQPAEGEG